MTSHYSVLRPVEQSDLDACPKLSDVLKMIPPGGRVTFERFRCFGKSHAGRGLAHACAVGILKRVSPHERVLELESVKFWCTQINRPGHKNTTPRHSTKQLYLGAISRFDEWLVGRSFPPRGKAKSGGQTTQESFNNVEAFMEYSDSPDYVPKTAQRVLREYAAALQSGGAAAGAQAIARSAIISYLAAHDIVLALPRSRKKRAESAQDDDSVMTIENFYKMLQNGRPGLALRTAMLITFQSGMDAATLADRFNYEGYSQIVKHFKTDDHSMWNLAMCPVPIKLVRVKTIVPYMTFLDHDAIVQLQEYLTWKEAKHGRHDASKPLFRTKQGRPIHSAWLSVGFSRTAIRAGIQKKVSNRVFKVRAHAVRHLLKSILITSGCAQYAADHVLGHAPRDAYEKQAILYPEMLRAEYAKASSRLNIFSKVENTLNSPKDPESQEARIRELEAQVRELTQAKAGEDLAGGKYKDAINGMNEKINRLVRLLDALPDDIKEKMPDELDG